MRSLTTFFVLSNALLALAHGGVKTLSVDNRSYRAYNPDQDEKFLTKRIAFKGPKQGFVTDQTSPDMACNSKLGAPALIAPARAGAKVNFMWNPWFASHKGPLLSYMAPYSGPVEKVDFNQLHFFKISEEGLSADGKTWAVDTMMARGNVSSTMIPHDLKPGTYVLRHELIALHYATEDSLYHMKADKLLGPQHYIQCFNILVSSSGSAEPQGVLFPGAYAPFRHEPGLYFDIWRNVSPYPIPGPQVHIPQSPAPPLEPLPLIPLQAPTEDPSKDTQYLAAVAKEANRSDAFTANVNAKHMGYGGNPDMNSPPPGSVPKGAVVRGARWKKTDESGLGGVEA